MINIDILENKLDFFLSKTKIKVSKMEKLLYSKKFQLEDQLKEFAKVIEYIEKFVVYKLYYERRKKLNESCINQKDSTDAQEFRMSDKEQKIKDNYEETAAHCADEEHNPLIKKYNFKLNLNKLSSKFVHK